MYFFSVQNQTKPWGKCNIAAIWFLISYKATKTTLPNTPLCLVITYGWGLSVVFWSEATHHRVLCAGCGWLSARHIPSLASHRDFHSCGHQSRTRGRTFAGRPPGTHTRARCSSPHTLPRDRTPSPGMGLVHGDLKPNNPASPRGKRTQLEEGGFCTQYVRIQVKTK